MNAKVSAFVICVEAIVYLLLYNLHDCIFNRIKFFPAGIVNRDIQGKDCVLLNSLQEWLLDCF